MIHKKNTRIGDSKKGEKYTRMKCVREKREHVKSPNDWALEVVGSTKKTVYESVGITRIQSTPKSFRVDSSVGITRIQPTPKSFRVDTSATCPSELYSGCSRENSHDCNPSVMCPID
jgi:hypothetical protein